ncbi:hypothetical protein PAMP_009620 [Pampus punctatissimus]
MGRREILDEGQRDRGRAAKQSMDEAEKYQQRLQTIAERRRQQEEEEKLRRETDEERLKTAQKKPKGEDGILSISTAPPPPGPKKRQAHVYSDKRKYLRDQWLSETATAPVLPSLVSFRPCPPLQDEADEHTAGEQTKSQKTPEDEEQEAADARKEEQASQEESKESVNCTARIHNHLQAGTDEDAQVKKEAEGHFCVEMAQRIFHESGQDGRSVLGMLAVQVEKDPKTGATVVRSVAPVSTPAGAPMAATVFDDGRKSIHTVGGSGGQPSTEELGQILSAIDGVGMKVLLDEVTVTPNKEEAKMENIEADRAPESKVVSFATHHDMSKESSTQLDSSRSPNFEAELPIECSAASVVEEEKKEDGCIMVVRNMAGKVDNIEDQRLEEVTLVFLGYTDDTTSEGVCLGLEDHEGMLTAERVIISDDGEEHVIEPQAKLENVADQEAWKESKEESLQDVPLDGNGAGDKVQGDKGDNGLHNSSSASIAEGKGTSKRKTCQCCSVM